MSSLRPTRPYDSPPYQGGQVKGLFIGINYKGSSAELNGCVNDVRTMLATLQRIGFPLQEAVILVDDPQFPGVCAPPTKANIEEGFRWLASGARPGDTFFLHYSGHGSQRKNVNNTEADGFDETLVPLDYETAGQIVDDDVYRMVVQPLPRGARLTAVMDCCHSGTLMDLPFEFNATRENMETYNDAANCGFKSTNRNQCEADVMLFSGCADDQTSADVTGGNFKTPGNYPGSAGGACTGALAEVFTTTNGLTFVDLLLGLRQSLHKRGFKQNPQLSASKPIDLTKVFSLFGSLEAVRGYQPPPPMQQQPPMMAPPPQQGQPPQPQGGPQGYPPPQQQPGPQGYPQGQPQPGAYPPPQQYPPQGPPPQQGYPPPQQQPGPGGYPPQGPQGYPPQQQSQYPPAQYPPAQYPPQQYPPAPGPYPPAQYPPQQYPPAQYPPQQPGYPAQGPGGYPPQGQYPPQGFAPQYPGANPGYPVPQAGYYPAVPQGGTAAMGSTAQPAWQQGKYQNPTYGRGNAYF